MVFKFCTCRGRAGENENEDDNAQNANKASEYAVNDSSVTKQQDSSVTEENSMAGGKSLAVATDDNVNAAAGKEKSMAGSLDMQYGDSVAPSSVCLSLADEELRDVRNENSGESKATHESKSDQNTVERGDRPTERMSKSISWEGEKPRDSDKSDEKELDDQG